MIYQKGRFKLMFRRLLQLKQNEANSVLLFGPRGSGKTTWLKQHLPNALFINLLRTDVYNDLLANPSSIEGRIPKGFKEWVIIDEIQKVPELLNEVHYLIEEYRYKFILTGSSARKLKQKGVNLLAGRARNYSMHPLTINELGNAFSLEKALKFGLLPSVYLTNDPQHYLDSYITTYLREEVLQEGLTRKLGEFTRFLEIASFSQGSLVNYSDIAREAAISRHVVTNYFSIVEDLLIGSFLPVFTKRATRRMVSHPKFYYFDVGVYRTLRPKGPLDLVEHIDGPALETLFLQHIRAINDYYRLGYELYYWRTSNGTEVDFIAYGEGGLFAFEIKRKSKLKRQDLKGLESFKKEYPMAKLYLIYGGDHDEYLGDVHAVPIVKALKELKNILNWDRL